MPLIAGWSASADLIAFGGPGWVADRLERKGKGIPVTFTIHGLVEDELVEITWSKGFVSGTKAALEELFALASVLEGKPVGPDQGPFTKEDHLASPLSAMILIEDIMDEITSVSGRLPAPLTLHAAEAA